MTNQLRHSALLLALVLGAITAEAAVPAWLKAAAATPTPAAIDNAPAVVLVDDSTIEIDAAGVMTETRRYAVRILHNAGRQFAEGEVIYNGASAKVESLGAWVVRGGKEFESKGNSDWLDLSAEAAGAVVDEIRKRTVDLSGRALTEDVFGYESRVRMPMTVAQTWIEFSGLLPKLQESYTLTLPPGFTLEITPVGAEAVVATHPDPQRWSWKLTGQSYRPIEPSEAGRGRIDATIFLQIVPPATATKFKPGRFKSWADVTTLSNTLNAPQCDSNPALVTKVRALAADSPDRLTTIRRVGGHVQSLRYIAFNRGLRYGYGWRARKATEVLGTGYGDCKDKANLMVAMLREVQIPAYMVLARLDQDRIVRGDFPSPIQFNHAIVAVPVGEDIDLPSVQTVPALGRCLFFDPTDPQTFVGDLSQNLQGGSVFVVAPGVEGLVQLPTFAPERGFRMERTLEMELDRGGAIAVSGTVACSGQPGALMRAVFRAVHQPAEVDKMVVHQLSSRMRNAIVTHRKVSDDPSRDRTELAFTCGLSGYMQLTMSANPVVRLDVLSREHIPNLTEAKRRLPVQLDPCNVVDDIKLKLPDGYEVAEVPAVATLQSEYGNLTISYEAGPGTVRMKRNLVLQRQVVPVADYAKLRKFLSDLARIDRSSVLLKRAAPVAPAAPATPAAPAAAAQPGS
jgi:hypothetical protein